MKKKILIFLMTAALAFASFGCTKTETEEPDGAGQEAAGDEVPGPEAPEPVLYTNPLTGEKTERDIENNRPYAVMLNNKIEALPQLGVSQADIIYEVCAEGGITRMEALFQSVEDVGNIGSIRSIRPYYIELATAYDSIVIHAGGSEEAYADLRSWRIDHFDGVRGGRDASIFWRDPDRLARAGYEHSMLTSGEKILEYVASADIRQTHESGYAPRMKFSDTNAIRFADPAGVIEVEFSNYKTDVFTYDPQSRLYMVEGHGRDYVDGNSGTQVGVTNVLVLNTSSKVLDSEGRLKVATTGSGSGYYFCGGKQAEISWSREGRNDAFRYVLKNGQELSFMPGKTYICVINPKVSSVAFE